MGDFHRGRARRDLQVQGIQGRFGRIQHGVLQEGGAAHFSAVPQVKWRVDQLLVTNHQGPNDEILPAIFCYEVEWNNLENGRFQRHTLTYGPSENKDDSPGVGAPGFAHGFYPQVGMTGPKWVFAAGDGSFDVWILKPKAGRFQYDTIIIDINGTTGQILDHDFDGDGIMDLLIPDNDFWKLHVITFE